MLDTPNASWRSKSWTNSAFSRYCCCFCLSILRILLYESKSKLVSSVNAIGRGTLLLSALSDSCGQIFENLDCGVPIDASVCDGDTLLEAGWTLRRDFLSALVDVGFNHDTDNGVLAVAKLICDDLGDLGLVAVVLQGVACDRIRDV